MTIAGGRASAKSTTNVDGVRNARQVRRQQGRQAVEFSLPVKHYDILARAADVAGTTPSTFAAVLVTMGLASWARDASVQMDQAGPVAAAVRWGESESTTRQQGLSLHEEIVEILESEGRPLSVSQIAEQIRLRGHYRPPRSGRPISAATVSRRVSNPQYKTLFKRGRGTVGLAGTRSHR